MDSFYINVRNSLFDRSQNLRLWVRLWKKKRGLTRTETGELSLHVDTDYSRKHPLQETLMKNFYQKLESFEDFTDLTSDLHFVRVPDDWWVIVVDIKDSTPAIDEGRYKDVNILGAAAIALIHEKLEHDSFPFAFGGDGATMVVPSDKLEVVEHQLSALRSLALNNFQLTMRCGAVPVSSLGQGVSVEVAKHRIAGNRCLAVFRGGGTTRAEEMIKEPESRYVFEDERDASVHLGALSCRWHPIPPRRDHSLTLLIKSRAGDDVYGRILERLAEIYGGNLDHADPIQSDLAQYRTIRQCIDDEIRYHRSAWSLAFVWRVVEITLAVLIFKHGMPAPFNTKKYALSMGRHSDYRKFDDMLRMVIDCSEEQLIQIRNLLEALHQSGEIYFGMHLAKQTLMTCLFHGAEEGKHIHFIDGGDGGYTMAAKYLKNQMQQSNEGQT